VSQNIQEVIKQHHAFYEVQPHYTALGRANTSQQKHFVSARKNATAT
jgi:hypothetical protein